MFTLTTSKRIIYSFNASIFILLLLPFLVSAESASNENQVIAEGMTYEDALRQQKGAEAREQAKAQEREKILEEIKVIRATPPSPMGPVIIRVMGTEQRASSGTVYVGDCDGQREDDDLEIISFSAPWKIVGLGGGGNGGKNNTGSPFSRSFMFEKSPKIGQKRLELRFFKESKSKTAESLVSDLKKVAEVANGNIPLYWVEEINNFKYGYVALFPVVELIGFPEDPEFTNYYYAAVSFTPVGPDNFEGWNEAEVIRLYNTIYTETCLGDGFMQGFSFFKPKLFID